MHSYDATVTSSSTTAQTTSRSVFAERTHAPETITGEAAAPMTNLIGNVETNVDGGAGVVVAATVIGYVPPAGLMVKVQIEPTDSKPAAVEAKEAADERARRGLPKDAAGAPDPAVRMADELSDADEAQVRELQARDASVRQEEQAHAAAAGSMAGPIKYEYATGPDGKRYVVNGSVPMRDTATAGDPNAAARMGRKLAAAAMVAQAPSSADYAAAAEGYRIAGAADRQAADEAKAPLALSA